MAVPRSRILDLARTQCRIFNTVFNPDRIRMGNKILRQRLQGPARAAYYPRRVVTFKTLQKAYPDMMIEDEDEEQRFEDVQITKSRGKGAPKKKKTAEVKGAKKKKR